MNASSRFKSTRWMLLLVGLTIGLVALSGLLALLSASAAVDPRIIGVGSATPDQPSSLRFRPDPPEFYSGRIGNEGATLAQQRFDRPFDPPELYSGGAGVGSVAPVQRDFIPPRPRDLPEVYSGSPRFAPSRPELAPWQSHRANAATAAGPPGRVRLAAERAEFAGRAVPSATPAITVSLTQNCFFGYTLPNAALTATIRSGTTSKGLAVAIVDGLGWLGNTSFFDQGRAVDVASGDAVDFFVNGAKTTVTLPTITGGVDPATDVVSGTISGVGLPASLTLLAHGHTRAVTTDAAGRFSTDWTGTADIGQDDQVDVAYQVAAGFWALVSLYPQNGFTVYETWNGVWGYTAPGTAVTVTLRAGDGTLKESGTATADATSGGWWYGAGVDVVPGDQVQVQVGGATVASTVSALAATVDVANDTVAGTGPANSSLRISFWRSEGTAARFLEQTVPTAGDGRFHADFAAVGIGRWRGSGYAVHADTPRADTALYFWAPYAVVDQDKNAVGGAAAAGASVTVTLRDAGGTTKETRIATADPTSGDYSAGFKADVVPGDTVQVTGGGLAATIPIVSLTAQADRTADTIYGTAPASAAHLRVRRWGSLQDISGPYYERDAFTSNAAGQYTANLGAEVDLHNNHSGELHYHTGGSLDDQLQVVHYWTPYLMTSVTHDWTWGQTALPGGPATLTLLNPAGGVKASLNVTQSSPDGRFQIDWPKLGAWVDPGDRVVLETGSYTEAATVVEIAAAVDAGADPSTGSELALNAVKGQALVTGTGPAWSLLWVQVEKDRLLYVPTDGAGHFMADLSGIRDIRSGETVRLGYSDDHFNDVIGEFAEPYLMVRANRTHDWVQGEAPQETNVVVRVLRNGQEIGRGESHTGGGTWFHVNPQQPDGRRTDIQTGDVVEVTAGGLAATVEIVDVTGAVDADTEVVSGRLFGVPYPATVRIEVWVKNGPSRDVQTDATGNFSADFSGFDIHSGDNVGIWYLRPDGHMAGIVRSHFRLETDVTDDDVWGQTTPGARVDLTLSAPGLAAGAVKARTTVWADAEGQFGTVFGDMKGRREDIAPGDTIAGQAGAKAASLTIPAPYSAVYDHVANTVCGEAPPGLNLDVNIWGYGSKQVTVGQDGHYCADFSDRGDPQIGDEGQVDFQNQDGHRLLVRFRTPAPDLWLQKWADSQPPAGREFTWLLRLGNGGIGVNAAAQAVAVEDTLPTGTSFVSASPAPAVVIGNRVLWNLGTLAERPL
jgi:hypothetical protein